MDVSEMAPITKEDAPNNTAATDVSLRFYSFLPCTQPKKNLNSSRTSGYCTDTSGVVVINDSDDEDSSSTLSNASEPQFEFLCEIDVDKNVALPRPIELKVECKKEPEFETDDQRKENTYNESNPKTLQAIQSIDYSDCEDELLALCKIEPVCDLNEAPPNTTIEQENNHYIYFTCPQCGERHDSHPHWRRHIEVVHQLGDQKKWNFKRRPNNEFECSSCRMMLTRCTLKTLQQHRFTHLPYKVYHCKLCPFEEHSMFLMISHIMLHREKDANCYGKAPNNNSAPTARELALWEHESSALIAYICPACGLTFETEDAWQAHINFSHNFLEKTAENRFGDHFKCSECAVEIFSQHIADLQQHLFTHLPYKSYFKCKVCSFTISRRNFMLSHILNLHKAYLSPSVVPNGDSLMTTATTTATSTTSIAGFSPAPVTTTTTTTSPRRERMNDGAAVAAAAAAADDDDDRRSSGGMLESDDLNTTFAHLRDDDNCVRRFSTPSRTYNSKIYSSHDSLRLTLKLNKSKGSFTCEKCTKQYLYRKSFDKHISHCDQIKHPYRR